MTRYLLLAPTLALLGAASPAPPAFEPVRAVSPEPEICRTLDSIARGQDDAQLRRLDELPPGQAYMAVYRTDTNGCIDPMLASERQGVRGPR